MNRRRAYFDHIINYNGVKSYPLYKKLSRRRETARCSVPYDYITTVAKLLEPGDGMRGVRHECDTKL